MSDIKVFSELENADKEQLQDFIACVEQEVLKVGLPFEAAVTHYLSRKVYAREMKLKADDLIVGKIHRFKNLNILSEGEVAVCSIDGIQRIKAPHTFVGSAGAKRIIYAVTDCTWTTIHGTEETDIDKIENEVIAEGYHSIKELEK